jgi:hypothetical protein
VTLRAGFLLAMLALAAAAGLLRELPPAGGAPPGWLESAAAPVQPVLAGWLWWRFEAALRTNEISEVEPMLFALVRIDRDRPESRMHLARWLFHAVASEEASAAGAARKRRAALQLLCEGAARFSSDPRLPAEAALLLDSLAGAPAEDYAEMARALGESPLRAAVRSWEEALRRRPDSALAAEGLGRATWRAGLEALAAGDLEAACGLLSPVPGHLVPEARPLRALLHALEGHSFEGAEEALVQLADTARTGTPAAEEVRRSLVGVGGALWELCGRAVQAGEPARALSLFRAINRVRGLWGPPDASQPTAAVRSRQDAEAARAVLLAIRRDAPELAGEIEQELGRLPR